MTDKTQAMDRLIKQDADLIELPAMTDVETIARICDTCRWWDVHSVDARKGTCRANNGGGLVHRYSRYKMAGGNVALFDSFEPAETLPRDTCGAWQLGQKAEWSEISGTILAALRQPAQSDALVIANERKAIAAWLRGEVATDYTDPEYDIGRNLADAIERGAYLQEQSK